MDKRFEDKKQMIIEEWNSSNISYGLIVTLIKAVPKHKKAMVRDVNAFNHIANYHHGYDGVGNGYFKDFGIYEMDMILKWKKILSLN